MTKLFIPYIMGNKDLIENATLLSENGADIIEIGVPFSDPVADGPVIMEAGQQAIKQGITIDYIFNQLEKHGDQIKCNYVLMTYYNIICHYGEQAFFEKCRDTGVYGLIIPDLPYELSQRLKQQFSHYGVKIISLVAMTTDDKRIKDIVSHAEGFIYTVTMNATTGQNGAFHPELKRKIESIKAIANVPVVAGFGIRTPQHVADIKEVADGIVIGNDAIGLGAIAAGSQFMAAYPITPASEVMEYMIANISKVNGAVIQTEDEIAAVTMAIGANYGGVRAFTASAGPGLSLMMEAIGLSGMTETPLVIINTQRGGPSTGLPTKQEQSDLMQMIYGTHGDIPKIVVAPTDAEDAFYLTMEAFNLAEQYQCPVIVLSDLQLSLGKQTVEKLDYNRIEIKRGEIIQSDIEREEDDKGYFKRYALTSDGVSPRPIPGVKGGIHHITGVEHNEEGKPSESASNRQQQMEKRMRKIEQLLIESPVEANLQHEDADILYIGFISTKGAIQEGSNRLNQQGIKVNTIQIRQLHPFPTSVIQDAVNKAKKVVVVEHNYQGQLASIIKMNVNIHDKIENYTKYDGTPFLPHEIEEKGKIIATEIKEMV
ncbi:tryptophan synthase subunit alpha [Staphylococcus aureus]|nr:tryptophan synthase subunit alpha [Staphylococcus aureus]